MTKFAKQLVDDLIRHEGLKLKPYRCTKGHLTIGVGRNLETTGISKNEALYLLQNDIEQTITKLESIEHFDGLDENRRRVVVNMAINLGFSGLMKFKKMWSAIQERNYSRAADEMLDSRWAKQVGNRAIELAEIMRTGAS